MHAQISNTPRRILAHALGVVGAIALAGCSQAAGGARDASLLSGGSSSSGGNRAGGIPSVTGGNGSGGASSEGGANGGIGAGGTISTAGGMVLGGTIVAAGGFGAGGLSSAAGGLMSSGAVAGGRGGLVAGGAATGGIQTGGVISGGAISGGIRTGGVTTATGGLKTDAGSQGGYGAGGIGATDGAVTDSPTGSGYLPAFIIGADVTITLEDEYWGATYTDAGQQKSIEQLLKDQGFNFIRIDTFVNPSAPGGYAAAMAQPFRDLAHTITLAKRVKAIGLGFILDFHYSDNWTNPGAQATPAAWAGLALSALETQVYNYTKDAVTQLKAAGATPDIVQIGNEITNGMLWPVGSISGSNFANFATLLKAGVRAVRDVNSATQILMHIEKCNNTTTSEWWLDGVIAQGVAFDILGQSCYATAPNGVSGTQGTPAQWQATFAALATRYSTLKFMIAEYSAEQRAANDTMFNLPTKRGLGTVNWDPTRAYATLPQYPLFSTNGAWNRYVAIPALMALYDGMAVSYGLK
jgi:arabinogalactan endo-1,4-beta-galactosidase